MKKASIRDLRYKFSKIERLLTEGEEVQITRRRKVIARLIPEGESHREKRPDFIARLHSIYGETVLKHSGAELLEEDRGRD